MIQHFSPPRSPARGRRRLAVIVTATALALGGTVAIATPAQASTSPAYATSITTNTSGGSTGSGQSSTTLKTQDMSGTATDPWAGYVEFSGKYNGYQTFALPAGVTASSVTALQLNIRYRGPSKANQAWTWSYKNWGSAAGTVAAGDNASASAWGSWASLSGLPTASTSSASTTSNLIGPSGQIQVNLTASNSTDAADIDVETLTVTYGAATDTQAPTAPGSLTATGTTATSTNLNWSASSDNVGVTAYDVYQGGTLRTTVTGTTAAITGLAASTTYSFTVKARDAAGNTSAASNTATVTTLASADTQAPTAPTSLTATGTTATSTSLSWGASTDNVGVVGYDVYQGSTKVTTVTATSAAITGLTASTTYSFTVKARDAAGNTATSSPLSVTTSAASGGVTLPPANGKLSYQTGGLYAPESNVQVVSRDRFDPIASGYYNICYVNLLQTQSDDSGVSAANQPVGTETWFFNNHKELLYLKSNGKPYEDSGWQGEGILDLRLTVNGAASPNQDTLFGIQKLWIDGCKTAGFKAIEPDNLDAFKRAPSGSGETFADTVAYVKRIVAYAHSIGMAIAQKNTNDVPNGYGVNSAGVGGANFVANADGSTQGFDFAIAEECEYNSECDTYAKEFNPVGTPTASLSYAKVFDIEYTSDGNVTRNGVSETPLAAACSARPGTSILYRDVDVTAPGDTDPSRTRYFAQWCPGV